jgi:hypothetical protein
MVETQQRLPEQTLSLPTFIIAGAPKCGTTALWGYLNDHPDVFMSQMKEPNFFTKTQTDLGNGILKPGRNRWLYYKNGLEWYEELFKEGQACLARGEASTHYFAAPDSAKLIQDQLPEIKLIFMLRDPAERTYSHYWQDVKNEQITPIPFEQLVQQNHDYFKYYQYVSKYRLHLGRFMNLFSPKQILVLLDSDLKQDPLGTYSKVCNFIGVRADQIPTGLGHNYQAYTVPKNRKIGSMLSSLRHTPIKKYLPSSLSTRLGSVLRSLTALNEKEARYAPLSQGLREKMISEFREDIDFVEALLGKDLRAWRTV